MTSLPGPWRPAIWRTGPWVLQVRTRPDGDVDVRTYSTDEFGVWRWSSAEHCPISFWNAEGVTPPPGIRVRMSSSLKEAFGETCKEHVDEFGDCEGVVLGPTFEAGPDVDVRWEPSGLRYGYDGFLLDIIATPKRVRRR